MLDYSQIKSGMFRQNFATLNIKDTVKKVMQMQVQKAKDKNIKFEVEFVRISDDNLTSMISHSSEICCDE